MMRLFKIILLLISPFATLSLCLKNTDVILSDFNVVNCSYGNFIRGIKNAIAEAEFAGDTTCFGWKSEVLDLFGLYDEYHACFNDASAACYEAFQILDISEGSYANKLYKQSEDDLKDKVYQFCENTLLQDSEKISYNDIGNLFTDENPHRWIKEFYDGNTFLNQEVQERRGGGPAGKRVDEGSEIRNIFRNESKSGPISWPEDYITNFDQCELNTVMCCWVTDRVINNNGNGDCSSPYPRADGADVDSSGCIDSDPADNTDVCYADHSRSPDANHVAGGFTIFPGDSEGAAHCHGFVWTDEILSDSNRFKANNLFYVSMFDHLRNRGYTRNIPGAPMCACLEQMPTVSRSDCTQTDTRYVFTFSIKSGELSVALTDTRVNFNACDDGNGNTNDLESKFKQLYPDEQSYNKYLVGPNNNAEPSNCVGAITTFLATNGVQTSSA
jgi:hypothetical protein